LNAAVARIILIGPGGFCLMFRRIVICLFVTLVAISVSRRADAWHRRHIDATPFAHAPCSVLDSRPCTPYFCSVFNHGPCIPEIDYPYGQDLQLTIETVPPQDQAAKYQKPDHDLDTIGDLFAALRSCFKRSGEMIAAPRMTFSTSGAAADTRATYLKAINASLDACLPLKFTGGLGGALAGRPIAIRYVDNRDLGAQAEKP
jgi:hypothetical protein